MRPRSRLAKLESALPARPQGPCPRPGVTAFFVRDAGHPGEPILEDLPACRLCGQPPVVIEQLVVVARGEEANEVGRLASTP